MTIADAHLYRYRLPLTNSLAVGDRTLTERQGLLLRLEGPDGNEGWGEAAPLPGFSREALAEAAAHGRRLAARLSGAELPESGLDALIGALPGDDLPPSVRFGAESAVVELWAAARGAPVVDVLGGGGESVALNALIPDATADLEAEARRLTTAGYQAVKLKVGRRQLEADAARVRTLRGALDPDVALRLDANRAWTVEQATAFAGAVEDLSLDYVEEPLSVAGKLPRFVGETGLPIALDETTREVAPEDLSEDLPIRAVILKPTLLGGLAAAKRWARWGRRRGATPVVSASYESGIGLRMLVALAAALSTAPAGLSTYDRLAADVLTPRPPIGGAQVHVADIYTSEVERTVLDSVDVAA